jgi:hypothetical protein
MNDNLNPDKEQLSNSEKELKKQLRRSQLEILKLVEKELKLVV